MTLKTVVKESKQVGQIDPSAKTKGSNDFAVLQICRSRSGFIGLKLAERLMRRGVEAVIKVMCEYAERQVFKGVGY